MSDRLTLLGWISLLGVWTVGHTIGSGACAEDSPIAKPDPTAAGSGGASARAAASSGAGGCGEPTFACCLGDVEAEPSCVGGELTCKDGWQTGQIGDCARPPPDASGPGSTSASSSASSAASSSAASSAAASSSSGCAIPCGASCCPSGENCCAQIFCATVCP